MDHGVGVVGDIVQDWFVGGRPDGVSAAGPGSDLEPDVRGAHERRSPLAGDAVRRAVTAATPISQSRTRIDGAVIRAKVTGIDYFAKVLTVMSGLALVLALTGMYSLMAYLSARRTKEIGLRVALGATRRQVIWLTASRAGASPSAAAWPARRWRSGWGV